jgi:hypothetical protein
MLHYIVIKQVDTAILGCHFSGRRDDHVILCSTIEFLFEFQNRFFLEFFARVLSCSSIKAFEVRGSAVLSGLKI